jgi:flagellar biogenesis protein FliO
MLQSVAGLAFVLALFGLLVWMLKRIQQQRFARGDGGAMRVVQRYGIDAKHSVIELSHNGNSYLIGISPNGMNTIASYPNAGASVPVGQAQGSSGSEA